RVRPQQRVPVLFQVSSWDPAETLQGWMERRLVEDYPWLANVAAFGPTVAAGMLTDRVLPILDGLDEMPAARRRRALAALDQSTAPRDPLALTCRSAEFAQAARGGNMLRSALTVTLRSLDVPAAVGYLQEAAGTGRQRWEPVWAELDRHPDG